MTLPKYFTTITPFSKYTAMALFVILPFIALYIGIQYQIMITPSYPPTQYIAPPDMKIVPRQPHVVIITATPAISCRPRPACLDAKPRCMIAVTADMCPPTPPALHTNPMMK